MAAHGTPLRLVLAGLSDVGKTRTRNEDSFGFDPMRGVGIVCDGMGGHAGGDIASQTAVKVILSHLDDDVEEDDDPDETDCDDKTISSDRSMAFAALEIGQVIARVRSAVNSANAHILGLNQRRGYPEGRGMGTTVAGLWLAQASSKIITFHAGDSRLYRLRHGGFHQLTRDHSLYQTWLENGGRGVAPQRNVITRALGIGSDLDLEIGLQAAQSGDLYLLCSDGLSSMVPDDRISSILQSVTPETPLQDACRRLIAAAIDGGGADNVTVVLARCLPDDHKPKS